MSKRFPTQDRLLNPQGPNKAFKTAMLMLLVVGVFMVLPLQISAKTGQNYGDIWKSLNNAERYFYLDGLQQGTHELAFLLWLFDGTLPPADPKEKAIIENLNLTSIQRNLLIQIIKKRLNEIDIELFGTEVIAKVMTDIYGDPANTYIDFLTIAEIAVMKLRGKSEKEVNKELEISRKAAAEVMKTRPIKP